MPKKWKGIVVHHTLSGDVSANEIDRWHKARGWKGIGYHYVIRENGDIEPGRPLTMAGAHAAYPAPSRNSTHIGICLTGDFSKHSPSDRQIHSLGILIRGLRNRFGDLTLERHHDTCPRENFPLSYIKRGVDNG